MMCELLKSLMAPWGLLPRPIRILSVSRLLVMVAYVVIGDRELKTPAEAETVYAMDKMRGSRDWQGSCMKCFRNHTSAVLH
ncbi:hypothetical protein ACFX2A_010147 [Malus domestica]